MATATYEAIATYSSSGSSTEFDFTAIANTYTDLVIIIDGKTTGGATFACQVNGDGSSLYSSTRGYGSGSTTGSDRGSGARWDFSIGSATDPLNIILQFQNYSNTSVFKSVLCRSNNPLNYVGAIAGLYRSTSAISSIKIYTTSTFASGTSATLYGIKAA